MNNIKHNKLDKVANIMHCNLRPFTHIIIMHMIYNLLNGPIFGATFIFRSSFNSPAHHIGTTHDLCIVDTTVSSS